MRIALVPTEYLDTCWDEVEPILQKAVDRQDKYEMGDVLFALSKNAKSLWIAFDEEGIKGVVVSTIIDHPIKKVLFLDYLSGVAGGGTPSNHTWKDYMFDILQKWAYDNNCDSIEFTGRIGWGRALENIGCKVSTYNFELPIGNKGIEE